MWQQVRDSLKSGMKTLAMVGAMDIAFTVDGEYFEHAAVAIESILQFEYESPISFWLVLSDDVSEGDRADLDRLVDARATVRYLSPERASGYGISSDPSAQHVSGAMYLRLQLVDLLPASVSRVLYLDADVLCVGPGLQDLFDVDLGGRPIAAVRDAFTRRMNDHGGLPLLEAFPGIDPQAMYFNSGVLLIDAEAWRAGHIRARCEDYLERSADRRRFPDQDALNVACYENWYRLDKKWNHMMAWRLEAERAGSLLDAVIIHSAGPMKHWQDDFPDGRRRDLYRALVAAVRSSQSSIRTA